MYWYKITKLSDYIFRPRPLPPLFLRKQDFNEKTFLVNESQENVVISNKIHVLKYSSFSIFKTVSWEGSPLSSRPCKVLMENSVTFLNVCRKVTWMKWVISICFIIQTTKHSSSIIIFFLRWQHRYDFFQYDLFHLTYTDTQTNICWNGIIFFIQLCFKSCIFVCKEWRGIVIVFSSLLFAMGFFKI